MVKPAATIEYNDVGGWGNLNAIINNFLGEYEDEYGFDRPCTSKSALKGSKPCHFDINLLEACKDAWNKVWIRPCVYFTLNTEVINIEYKAFNKADLPNEMPKKLKSYISGLSGDDLNHVFIECHGKNETIFEEQIDKLDYYPQLQERGRILDFGRFPFYYFEFKNEEGFESPIVAIQIEKKLNSEELSQPINGEVEIECFAWAKNIDGDNDFISADIVINF